MRDGKLGAGMLWHDESSVFFSTFLPRLHILSIPHPTSLFSSLSIINIRHHKIPFTLDNHQLTAIATMADFNPDFNPGPAGGNGNNGPPNMNGSGGDPQFVPGGSGSPTGEAAKTLWYVSESTWLFHF